MNHFEKILARTLRLEGLYVDHPADPGGETVMGIARNRHPGWPGWKVIDERKLLPAFPKNLEQDRELNNLIKEFYRSEFWNKICGDQVSSFRVAQELFDSAVNVSPLQAVKFLQGALNALNRNTKLFPDLKVDGIFGSKTSHAIGLMKGEIETLVFWMNIAQGCYYLKITEANPKLEAFLRGWMKRLE